MAAAAFKVARFLHSFRAWFDHARQECLGHAIPSANHLLKYEKEFATDEDSFIPKPWFCGYHVDLLSGRSDQTADADLLQPSLRVCS